MCELDAGGEEAMKAVSFDEPINVAYECRSRTLGSISGDGRILERSFAT